ARYTAPLTPLLALALVRLLAGFRDATRRRSGPWRAAGPIAFAAIVAVVLGLESFHVLRAFGGLWRSGLAFTPPGSRTGGRLFFYGPKWREFDASVAWLKDHARGDAVVATRDPHRVYLKTGLPAVMPPVEP